MKQEFFEFFDFLVKNCKEPITELPKNVEKYLEILKSGSEVEKPLLTENGKMIMEFLQGNSTEEKSAYKAKEMAEALFVSSRTISGSVRKLVTDGFVEKIGKDPALYMLTEKGKELDVEGVEI